MGTSLGVAGAGIGLLAARTVGLVLALRSLHRRTGGASGAPQSLRPQRRYLRAMLRLGWPAALEAGFFHVGKLITQGMVAGLGTTAMAANFIAFSITALLNKHSCSACHGVDKAIVGPGFQAIAKKHAGRADLETYLKQKIKVGGQGVWGAIPMPPQSLPDADAAEIAKWIASGARR